MGYAVKFEQYHLRVEMQAWWRQVVAFDCPPPDDRGMHAQSFDEAWRNCIRRQTETAFEEAKQRHAEWSAIYGKGKVQNEG